MNKKLFLFLVIGFFLVLGVAGFVESRSFTIYNSSNENIPYFSVNGSTGFVGLGTESPLSVLQIPHDQWISGTNAAGTGIINMFKINSNNQIEVGGPLNIGSFEFSPDSGLVSFVDMPVTSSAAAGTAEGYVFKIDGDNLLSVYAESDGLGGIQNRYVGINGILDMNNNKIINLANGTSAQDAVTYSQLMTLNGTLSGDMDNYYLKSNPFGFYNSTTDGPDSGLDADTLDGSNSSDFANVNNSVFYIQGTGTTAGTWLGTHSSITEYYDGLTIAYRIPVAGASTTTLNINGFGAVKVYRNTGSLTTHLPVDTVVVLTYATVGGVGRWVWSDYDSNTYDRTYWGNAITAGTTIYDYKLLMRGTDGKWYPLTLEEGTGTTKTISTQEFVIGSPILYYATTTNVAPDATLTNVYSEIPMNTLSRTANQASWVSQKPIYLVGSINSNGNFVLDDSSYTSFMTQDLPTTEDGKVYVLLGQMYSTTAMRLHQYHPMYEYKNGGIRSYAPAEADPYYFSNPRGYLNETTISSSETDPLWTSNFTNGLSGNLNLNGNWLSGDGGNEGVFVDSAGKVGIGTSSPSEKLAVYGNTDISGTLDVEDRAIFGTNNAYGIIGSATPTIANSVFAVAGSSPTRSFVQYLDTTNTSLWAIRFHDGGSNYRNPIQISTADDSVIFNEGNVGIGTASPKKKLDVEDISDAQMVLHGWNTEGTNAFSGSLQLGHSSTIHGKLQFDGGGGDVYLDNFYDNNAGDIFFRTRVSGDPVNAMTIRGSGNVGIGTISPQAKLDVQTGANDSIVASFGVDANNRISLYDYESGGFRSIYAIDDGSYGSLNLGHATSPYLFVETGGNVGIGTANPGEKLDVQGNINATGDVCANGICLSDVASNASSGNVGGVGSANRAAFWTDADTLGYDGNFTWDDVNKRLGIGTTTPQQKLHVTGSAVINGTLVGLSNATDPTGAVTKSQLDAVNSALNGNISDNYVPYTGATQNVDLNSKYLSNVDRLGIGIVSPQAALHVNYPTSGNVIFQAGTGDGGSDMDFKYGYNGYGWYNRYLGSGGGDNNEWQLWSEGAGSTDQQVYGIKQSGNIDFKKQLSVQGNLGVGTTTPQNKLNVVGDTNVTGALYVGSGGDLDGQYDFNGGWQSNGLSIIDGAIYAQTGYFYNISSMTVNHISTNGSLYPSMDNQFDLGSPSARWNDLYLGGDLNVDGTINGNISGEVINPGFTTGSVVFAGSSGELAEDNSNLFWDDSNNRLGIGTGSPSQKLDVVGNANLTGYLYINDETLSTESVTFDSTGTGLRLSNANGYITLTPLNTGWAHIYTDRSNFIFNQPVYSIDNIFSSYNNDLLLKRAGTTKLTLGSSASAFADSVVTAGGNTMWHAGNDGTGSTLDADLLDGLHATHFYNASNPAGYITSSDVNSAITDVWVNTTGDTMSGSLNIPISGAFLSNNGNHLDGADAWINLGNPTYHWNLKYVGSTSGTGGNEFRIESASSGRYFQMDHDGNIEYYDGSSINKMWHEGNDGPNTGLNADLLDGYNSSDFLQSADLANYVTGPASSTDNAVARFDSTTGKIIQNSGVTIDDSGMVTISGQGNSGSNSYGMTDDVALNLVHSSGGNSTIYFKSGVNYPSDYGYIKFEDSYTGSGENARLTIGVENDQASNDYVRIKSRLDVDSDGWSNDNSNIQRWLAAGVEKAVMNNAGDLQLDGDLTASGAISGTTINTGLGAMEVGDTAVTDGDTSSVPTGNAVYDFVTGQGYISGVSDVWVNVSGDTMSGTLNMNNNLITNIGNAGTDFTSGGGLTLAGAFDPNGAVTLPTTGISGAGSGSGLDADTLDGLNSSNFANVSNSVYYVEGTGTTAGTWLGSHPDITEYYDGLKISYKIPVAGATTTTLNINGLGAIKVYRATSSLTTHLPVNTVVYLTYTTVSGTGRWVWANYVDGTESYTVRWSGSGVIAGETITRYKLLMMAPDGRYHPIAVGDSTAASAKTINSQPFVVNSPILAYYTTATIAAGSATSTAYIYSAVSMSTNFRYNQNVQSGWTAHKPIYLKGTINNDGLFVLAGAGTTGGDYLTQDLPTTEDGYVYIMLGMMYSTTTSFRLNIEHPIIEFKDGKLRQYNSPELDPFYFSNPYNYLNSTSISGSETDPKWTGNYSTFLTHINWAQVTNGTMATAASVTAANTSMKNYVDYTNGTMKNYVDTNFYLKSNPYGFINSTNLAGSETDPKWTGNYSSRTGTGNVVYSASPTFTGTLNAATISASGDGTFGTNSRAANTYVRALAADGYNAGFEAYGASQGTGYMYVGQSTTHGGGMFYNGDGTPAFATGEGADRISFYRRTSGANEVVFSYAHNSNDVTFRGAVDSATQFLGQASDSVSAPSFSWTGDTNVGMYRPTTDTLGFTTNGVEKMRITSTGEVGIGITPTTAGLVVNKAVSGAGIDMRTNKIINLANGTAAQDAATYSQLQAVSSSISDDQTLTEVLAEGNSAGTYGINMNNNLIENIGNAGTDFTSGGGLTLAGTFDPNGAITLPTTGISGAGSGSGLDADLLDGLNSSDFANVSNSVYYIEGTGSVAGTWLGTHPEITGYYDGLKIAYKIGIAGASTTTLNINGLGASQVYRATGALTTHLPVNTVVYLTYTTVSGVGRWVWADYTDGTESYTVRWNNYLQAGDTISKYKIVMMGTDGKWYPLTIGDTTAATKTVSSTEFQFGSKILVFYSSGSVATNGISRYYFYDGFNMGNLHYTLNQASGFSNYMPIYLVGTINSNGNFVLDGAGSANNNFWTQTLPTTEDGKVYVQMGIMSSTTTSMRLLVTNPIYEYKNGAIRLYNSPEVDPAYYSNPLGYLNSTSISGAETDPLWTGNISSVGFLNQAETVTSRWAFNGGTSGSTSPFTVDSNTVVTNLNADLLDGIESENFARDGLSTGDLNSVANIDDQLTYARYSSSALNKPVSVNNANGVLTMTSHSGPYGKQIAFADNEDLYIRKFSNNVFGTWRKLWHEGNDGSGSGLDADLLDGYNSSDFLQSADLANYVTGPASSTDNAIARFHSTTGKIIQNSGVTIDDSNNMVVGGDLTITGNDLYGSGGANFFETSGYATSKTVSGISSAGTISYANIGIAASQVTSGEFDRLRVREMMSKDTRNTNPDPQDYNPAIQADFKANSADGLADGGTYHGVLSFRPYGSATDFSGGPMHQMGFTSNGNLHLRTSSGTTSWNSWNKLWHDGNDGSGSGLDADLLDGYNSSDFLQSADLANYVTGPASSTDNAIARFHSTTGKIIQNSGVTIDDSNNMVVGGDIEANSVKAQTSQDLVINGSSGTGNVVVVIG